MRQLFALLTISFAIGILAMAADAATVTAVARGNWTSPETWDGGRVPGKSDKVIIPRGITVFLTRPIGLALGKEIMITIGGVLDLTNGQVQLDEGDSINVLPEGRISASGLGGIIFSGNTPVALEAGYCVMGPATIDKTNHAKIEKAPAIAPEFPEVIDIAFDLADWN
jgi:hypothetical protein